MLSTIDRPASSSVAQTSPSTSSAQKTQHASSPMPIKLIAIIVTLFSALAAKLEQTYEIMYADWTSLIASAGTVFGTLAKSFEKRNVTRHELGLIYTRASNYVGQAAQAVLASLETPLFNSKATKRERLQVSTCLMNAAEQVRTSKQFADWDQSGSTVEKVAQAFEKAAELVNVDNVDRQALGEQLNTASQGLREQAIQISKGFKAEEVVNAAYDYRNSGECGEPSWQHDKGAVVARG